MRTPRRSHRLGSKFYDAVEDVTSGARSITRAWAERDKLPEQAPSLEQVGILYLFAHSLDVQAEQLKREADELLEVLPELQEVRWQLTRAK